MTTTTHSASGIRGAIRRAPVLSFVIIAFGLSWLSWLGYILGTSGLGVLPLHFPETPVRVA